MYGVFIVCCALIFGFFDLQLLVLTFIHGLGTNSWKTIFMIVIATAFSAGFGWLSYKYFKQSSTTDTEKPRHALNATQWKVAGIIGLIVTGLDFINQVIHGSLSKATFFEVLQYFFPSLTLAVLSVLCFKMSHKSSAKAP